MKTLTQHINEVLVKHNLKNTYSYSPQTKTELRKIIFDHIQNDGNNCDLNDIDVSAIEDMSELFSANINKKFMDITFDISKWDVSNVTVMRKMFHGCHKFNCDISNWDVSKVTDMSIMFSGCNDFNQDISNWDVSKVTDMQYMFASATSFDQNLSNWSVKRGVKHRDIFYRCPIEEKYKPNF